MPFVQALEAHATIERVGLGAFCFDNPSSPGELKVKTVDQRTNTVHLDAWYEDARMHMYITPKRGQEQQAAQFLREYQF